MQDYHRGYLGDTSSLDFCSYGRVINNMASSKLVLLL